MRGLKIDYEFKFCWRLYRQVTWLFTLEDASNIRRRAAEDVGLVWRVGHHAAVGNEIAQAVGRR